MIEYSWHCGYMRNSGIVVTWEIAGIVTNILFFCQTLFEGSSAVNASKAVYIFEKVTKFVSATLLDPLWRCSQHTGCIKSPEVPCPIWVFTFCFYRQTGIQSGNSVGIMFLTIGASQAILHRGVWRLIDSPVWRQIQFHWRTSGAATCGSVYTSEDAFKPFPLATH